MNEDNLNMEIRKFLKKVGITSQRIIEKHIYNAEKNGDIKSGDEIDLEMNIFPCCFFYLDKLRRPIIQKKGNDIPGTEPYIEDTTLDNINNSLKTNKLENILKEFKKVLNEDVWNSNKCPALCKETCER